MTEDSSDAGDVKSTRLRELQALADEGLITPDEYEQHRRRIRGETGDGEPVDAATAEAAPPEAMHGGALDLLDELINKVWSPGTWDDNESYYLEEHRSGTRPPRAGSRRGVAQSAGRAACPRTAAQPSPQATATRRGSRRDLWQLPRLRGTTSGGVDRDWPWRRWRSAACDSGGGARPVGSRNGVRGERSLASARDTHRAPIER